MIAIYLVLLIVLALLHALVRVRVRRLERKFTTVAGEADKLLKQQSYRGGNSSRPDPYLAAKQQYALAQLAIKRDRTEGRYDSWQGFSERFGHFRRRLSGYRGKTVPYVLGVLDVVALTVVLDRFGFGLADLKTMLGI
jgi:hypothetical protein